ncbi:MAG: class I SAM-dependent methyltransferase [Nitrospinae bacterium]|nr:class I SAM-dependent methyltransferase [Nitrospinota bacterium]
MICKVCNATSQKIFSSRILNKYDIEYFYCKECGFLQTEEPYWLSESYQSSINMSDTGIIERNIYFSKITAIILYFLFNQSSKYLDFAGGYGILTRLMRDIGFDFYWSDEYTQNLFARGFEYSENTGNIKLITCFEGFEHFINPIKEIEKMLNISKNILFSTYLLPNPIPKPDDWWYYGLEHGQHVSFYSSRTFELIAKRKGLSYYSNGSMHMLTEKKINKLYFKHLDRLYGFGIFSYIKRKMKSRTSDDMKYIISTY